MTVRRTQLATIAIMTDDNTKVIRLHQVRSARPASMQLPMARTAISNPAPLHSRATSSVTMGRMMYSRFSKSTGMPSACNIATDMFALRS